MGVLRLLFILFIFFVACKQQEEGMLARVNRWEIKEF